jgi:hypothetical protein
MYTRKTAYSICAIKTLNVNFSHSTRLLAATTLRNVLGTRNLAEILSGTPAKHGFFCSLAGPFNSKVSERVITYT